jgi:hypothetical protein
VIESPMKIKSTLPWRIRSLIEANRSCQKVRSRGTGMAVTGVVGLQADKTIPHAIRADNR